MSPKVLKGSIFPVFQSVAPKPQVEIALPPTAADIVNFETDLFLACQRYLSAEAAKGNTPFGDLRWQGRQRRATGMY